MAERMTVVIFVTSVYELPNSGPATFAKILSESFHDSEIKFIIVTSDAINTADDLVVIRRPKSSVALYFQLWRKAKEIAALYKDDYVIIHYNNSFPYAAFGTFGDRTILQMNDYYNIRLPYISFLHGSIRRSFAHIFRKLTERLSIHHSDVVLCNSRHTQNEAIGYYKGQHQKFRLLYKSIDDADLGIKTIDEPSGEILYIGNDLKLKGFDILAEALKSTSRVQKLHIAGPAANNPLLNQLLHQVPQHIAIVKHGALTHKELYALSPNLDMLVLPARYEALGVSVIECLAQGLPVLTSGVGGLMEILEEYPAEFYSASNLKPSILASNIDLILENYKYFYTAVKERIPTIRNKFEKRKTTNYLKTLYLER